MASTISSLLGRGPLAKKQPPSLATASDGGDTAATSSAAPKARRAGAAGKKRKSKRDPGGLLYEARLHSHGEKFRRCRGASRRTASAFGQAKFDEIIACLRSDKRKTVTLASVINAIRSCTSTALGENIISAMETSREYPHIVALSKRRKTTAQKADENL